MEIIMVILKKIIVAILAKIKIGQANYVELNYESKKITKNGDNMTSSSTKIRIEKHGKDNSSSVNHYIDLKRGYIPLFYYLYHLFAIFLSLILCGVFH